MLNYFKNCPICDGSTFIGSTFILNKNTDFFMCSNFPKEKYRLSCNCHYLFKRNSYEELYTGQYIIDFNPSGLKIFKMNQDENCSYTLLLRLDRLNILYEDLLKINLDINLAVNEFIKNYLILK